MFLDFVMLLSVSHTKSQIQKLTKLHVEELVIYTIKPVWKEFLSFLKYSFAGLGV